MIGIGEAAARGISATIDEGNVSAATRKLLKKCLGPLTAAIEELCPAVIGCGPEGFAVAYGPDLPDARHLFCFATPRTALCLTTEFPAAKLPPAPKLQHVAVWWGAIAAAVNRKQPEMALLCLQGRLESDGALAMFEHQYQTIKKERKTPLVVVLAAATRTKATGVCLVLPLPASIEIQLATQAPAQGTA